MLLPPRLYMKDVYNYAETYYFDDLKCNHFSLECDIFILRTC